MNNKNEEKSFWSTVPGILTGIAAIITAVGGLIIALNAAGIITIPTPTHIITTPTPTPLTPTPLTPTPTTPVPPVQPDLSVKILAPTSAIAGTDIRTQVKVEVQNMGNALAIGTESDSNGYMIDVILSSDTNVPDGFALYSSAYREDVLLKGGRISKTKSLAAEQNEFYQTGAGIPADTPTGNYYICAKVDPGNKVTESNEGNNVACEPIRITRL